MDELAGTTQEHCQRALLPRSAPAATGMSSRAIAALLDRLEAHSIE
jgi:hypothetical protein